MKDSKYFDKHGFMEPYGENGILFTSEYLLLKQKSGRTHSSDINLAVRAFRSVENTHGDIVFVDGKGTWSHDNHTGYVCMSKNYNFSRHKNLFPFQWWRRAHPRDIVFYHYIAGKWTSKLAFFFLWVPAAAMILSCMQDYKVRQGRKILKTDGKILAWMRFNSVSMPITKALCSWAIRRNKEFGSWKNCFRIYFGDQHPNSNFAEDVYDE